MFKRLLNVTINNSRILLDQSPVRPVNHQAFRLDLVSQILNRHLSEVPKSDRRQQHTNYRADLPTGRLNQVNHFIVRNRVEGSLLTADGTSRGRQRCLWCYVREKRSKRTVYICNECEVPLCFEGCFMKFHTLH